MGSARSYVQGTLRALGKHRSWMLCEDPVSNSFEVFVCIPKIASQGRFVGVISITYYGYILRDAFGFPFRIDIGTNISIRAAQDEESTSSWFGQLLDMTLGDDNVLEDPPTNDSGCKLDVAKRGFSVQVKNTFIEVLDEDEDVASVGAVSAPECHLRTSLLIAEDDSSICGETSDKTYAEVTEATGIATFQRVDAGSQTLPLEQTETGMQTQSMPKPRTGRVNGRATQTDSDNRPSDFELPTVTNPCWTEVAVLRKDDIVKIEVPFLSHDREVVIDSAAPSWGQNIQKMMICMMGKIDGTADDILEVKTLANNAKSEAMR